MPLIKHLRQGLVLSCLLVDNEVRRNGLDSILVSVICDHRMYLSHDWYVFKMLELKETVQGK